MAEVYKQKCWTCKYACRRDLCVWVATLKAKPKGCVKDNQGYIIECPQYEFDMKVYNKEDEIRSLGLTPQEYRNIKGKIYRRGLKMSVTEYLKKVKEETESLNITEQEYDRILRIIKYNNLSLSVFEFFKLTKNKKSKIKNLVKEHKSKNDTRTSKRNKATSRGKNKRGSKNLHNKKRGLPRNEKDSK